jgi:outer membrane protein TolC
MLAAIGSAAMLAAALASPAPGQNRFICVADDAMADIHPATPSCSAPPPPQQADICCIPAPPPQVPDPRIFSADAPVLKLDIRSSLRIAVCNSEVVRVIPGVLTTIPASPTGGSPGYQATQANSGIGLNPLQQPPRNLPYLLNTGSGGFGPSSQGGFGAEAMPFVGGNGGNGGATTDSTVSDPTTTSANAPFATIYDPAIAAAQVESARGAFDPMLTSGSFWESTDRPTGFLTDGFLITPEQQDASYLRTSITKPLLSGAQVGVAFNNDYYFRDNNPNPAILNPQYQPNAEFGIVQPLLRGFGTAVNEAGIQIAGARANQSDWEFKRRMMEMVRSVESAYWQLYATQLSLQSIDEAIPQTEEILRVEIERQKGGTAIAADVGHARSNLLRMRNQRLQAVSNINEKYLTLRNLLGLPPSDQRPILLVDRPVTEKVAINWDSAINIAIEHRPDVVRDRLAVYETQLQVMVAKNATLPQLNGEALYRVNGLGNDVSNSLDVLGSNNFTDWRLGFVFQYPLGNHVAQGQLRTAQLQVMRQRALLKQTMHIATHQMADLLQQIDSTYLQYQAALEEQQANNTWREGAGERFKAPAGGTTLLQALDEYLQAIDNSVTTNQQAAQVLASYNIQLAQLQEAMGTILEDQGIQIANDPVTKAKQTIIADCAVVSKVEDDRSGEPLPQPAHVDTLPTPPSTSERDMLLPSSPQPAGPEPTPPPTSTPRPASTSTGPDLLAPPSP